jgi:hypothetical protein
MAQLVVMYKTPKDAAAFDQHYFDKHVSIAKKLPGLRKYEVAIQGAFGSAEGQAAVADVQNFATGGVDILMFDTLPV